MYCRTVNERQHPAAGQARRATSKSALSILSYVSSIVQRLAHKLNHGETAWRCWLRLERLIGH